MKAPTQEEANLIIRWLQGRRTFVQLQKDFGVKSLMSVYIKLATTFKKGLYNGYWKLTLITDRNEPQSKGDKSREQS